MTKSPISGIIIGFVALHASFIAYLGKSLFVNVQGLGSDPPLINGLIRNSDGFFIQGVNETLFDCSPAVSQGEIGNGWQKIVHSLSNSAVAKFPRLFGPAHQECLHNGFSHQVCRLHIMNAIVEEVRWLHKLKNVPGVIQIISYCIPPNALDDLSGLRVVVEKGEPLTSLSLVQLSWQKRRKIVEEILYMVLILKDFSFLDFRRQQFVLVNGKPKLSDMDHIRQSPYDEKHMAEKIHQEFIPFLLTSDVPPSFRSAANRLNSSLTALKTLFFTDHTSAYSGSTTGSL